MKYTATIKLHLDIEAERDMGIEISDDEIEDYAISEMVEYIYSTLRDNSIYEIIRVEQFSVESDDPDNVKP
jgi:hypothetical protein